MKNEIIVINIDGKFEAVADQVRDPAKLYASVGTDKLGRNMVRPYSTAEEDQRAIDNSVAIASIKPRKIAEVKSEANRRILARMPDFKQRNYIAFNLEMEKKERKGGTLTTEEIALVTFTEGEWEFAKAIRSASNVIEAEIALLTDAEAGVFDVENHPLWVV